MSPAPNGNPSEELEQLRATESASTADAPGVGTPPRGRDLEPGTVVANRYVVGRELNHGGMGVVYEADDRVLARAVALKTVLAEFGGRPNLAVRFREEALITGQLQHPGVPPVHDLGTLPDGRPFLTMKLIKGQTLHQLLNRRPDPAADRPRFLRVVEQVAQALGYAHSRGVIHRDVKPANVMVGAFGEVQVMDWGLAKVLTGRDSEGELPDPDAGTVIWSGRAAADHSQDGDVKGTPAYMPPEQASGQIGRVDQRSDVFALGAILCEVLTGQPPYHGPARLAFANAVLGLIDPALDRLAGCGADPDLVALARACLSLRPDDRPPDAAAVAAHLAGRAARRDMEALLGLARQLWEQFRWDEAGRLIDQAERLLGDSAPADLAAAVVAARHDLGLATALAQIREMRVVWNPEALDYERRSVHEQYAALFAATEYDGPPATVAAAVAASKVRRQLLDGLDDWMIDEPDPATRGRLLEIAGRIDPDPLRNRCREAIHRNDPTLAHELAVEVDPAGVTTPLLLGLVRCLDDHGADPTALVERCLIYHTADFWMVGSFAAWFAVRGRHLTALRYFHAALALRPADHGMTATVGACYFFIKDYPLAEAYSRRAIEQAPDFPFPWVNLGLAVLLQNDRPEEAVNALRRAVAVAPNYANAWRALAMALRQTGNSAQAADWYRKCADRWPDDPGMHKHLAETLALSGDRVGAFRVLRDALARNPAWETNADWDLYPDAVRYAVNNSILPLEDRPEAWQQALDWFRLDVENWERVLGRSPEQHRKRVHEVMAAWIGAGNGSVAKRTMNQPEPPTTVEDWTTIWQRVKDLHERTRPTV